MRGQRKLLIQSNGLWGGVFLTMALFFLIALTVQVHALPESDAPRGTPEAVEYPVPQSVDVLALNGTPQYLPDVWKGASDLPTATPTTCDPSAIGSVGVGLDPYGSASDEVNEVFVANHAAGTVSVLQGNALVDTIGNKAGQIGVFMHPYGVAYNPVNNLIYVTDEGNGKLVLINPLTHAIVKELNGGGSPRGVGIDRVTGTAYSASPDDNSVVVWTTGDVAAGTGFHLVNSVGLGPTGVAVDSGRHRAFVTLQGEANYGLAYIDNDSQVITIGINVPGAMGIAIDETRQRLFVASGTGATLSIIDLTKVGTAQNPVIGAVKTTPEYSLDSVAVNPTSGHVWVSGRRDGVAALWMFDSVSGLFASSPFLFGTYPAGTFVRGTSYDPVRGWVNVSGEDQDRVYLFNDCGPGGGNPPPPPPPSGGCNPSAIGSVGVGLDPYGSASDEVDEVFVANHAAGTVSVLHGSALVDTIGNKTGQFGVFMHPYGVAYNPVNNLIYVTDEGNGKLVLINPVSHAIVKELNGGGSPRGVGIDRTTGTSYTASPDDRKVLVWTLEDVANGFGFDTINSVGVGPSGLVVDSERHRAFVTLQGEANYGLGVIDGTNFSTIGINVPGALGIAIDETRQRLYVVSGTAATLTIVDLTKVGTGQNPVVGAVKTSPEYSLDTVAINPATGNVYVSGRRQGAATVWVYKSDTGEWLTTPFSIGGYPDGTFIRGTTFDPIRDWVYVSGEDQDRVYLFSDCGSVVGPTPTPTNTAIPGACYPRVVGTPVAVGTDPYGIASDEVNDVFVANHAAGTVSVLRGSSLFTTISGFMNPYGVAYNPVNQRIYVTDQGNGQLVIVNPVNYQIEKRLNGGGSPRGVGIDRVTGTAYSASPDDNSVLVWTTGDVAAGTGFHLVNSVGVGPTGVVVDSGRHRAFVTLQGEANYGLAYIDNDSQVTTIGINVPGAMGIAIDETRQRLYVASGTGATLSIVDLTKVGTADNPVVGGPKTNPEFSLDWPAVNPTSGRVFVTGRRQGEARVFVLNGSTATFLQTSFSIGSYPDGTFLRGAGFDPVRKWVYASSENVDKVYVFDDNGTSACP